MPEEPEGDAPPPTYPDSAVGSLMRQRDALQNGINGDRSLAATLITRADDAQKQVDQLDAAITAMSAIP